MESKNFDYTIVNDIVELYNIQCCRVGTNDNFLTFTNDELKKSASTMKGVPIVANMLGDNDTDHATNSIQNVVGWTTDAWYDEEKQIVFANGEITHPQAIELFSQEGTNGKLIRYVSMGCNCTPMCSICNKNINGCGHLCGQKYDGEICTEIATNIKFEHLALTNLPADNKADSGIVVIKRANKTASKIGSDYMAKRKAEENNVSDKVEKVEKSIEQIKEDIVKTDETKKETSSEEIKKEEIKKESSDEMPINEDKKDENKEVVEKTAMEIIKEVAQKLENLIERVDAIEKIKTEEKPIEEKKEEIIEEKKEEIVEEKKEELVEDKEKEELKQQVAALKIKVEQQEKKEIAAIKKELLMAGYSELVSRESSREKLEGALEVLRTAKQSRADKLYNVQRDAVPRFVASNTKSEVNIKEQARTASRADKIKMLEKAYRNE